MAERRVAAERHIGAPAEHVYRLLTDFRAHHARVLRRIYADELERLDRYARGA